MSGHVHKWELYEVSVGPPSAELWGPQMAELLDDEDLGPIVRDTFERGELALTEEESDERAEVLARYRFCLTCGAREEIEI